MPVEIEAKIKLAEHDSIRLTLQRLGATARGKRMEENIFFDRPDHSLRQSDQGLRVRVARDEQTGHESVIVTYKGPRQHGPLKSREEIELRADHPNHAILFLEHLGFERTLSFQKKRESWKLGDCLIELDEVPFLGTYLEVEGPTESAVQETLKTIGLENEPHVNPSYIALLSEYMEKQGRTERVIRF
jgi:adenylate cyclase, class 2